MLQQSLAGPLAAHQRNRINVEHQRRRATGLVRLRKEQPRDTERQFDLVGPRRILVQQVTEIRGGPVGGRDLKKHALIALWINRGSVRMAVAQNGQRHDNSRSGRHLLVHVPAVT